MVFLGLLFQVALGVLGVFPTSGYASHQRLDARSGGPHWGDPDLPDAAQGAGTTGTNKAAASENIAAAHAARGEESSTGAPAASSAAAEQQRPQTPVTRHLPVRSFGHTEETASTGIQSESPYLASQDPSDGLDLPALFDLILTQERGEVEDAGPRREAQKDGEGAFSLFRAFSDGVQSEEVINSFSAAFKANPGLAELFLQGPFDGRTLRNPRQKRAVEVQGGRLTSTGLTMCGRRDQDEDTLVVDAHPADSPYTIKALFDGHGGTFTSTFCSANIHSFLNGIKNATSESLLNAFLSLDAALLQSKQLQESGSTGIVALIEEIEEAKEFLVSGREVVSSASAKTLHQILQSEDRAGSPGGPLNSIRLGGPEAPGFLVTIANVGDSRATLFHANGGFTVLSRDHKPTNPEELQRIEQAGGFVSFSPFSVPRVDGILALSRAFGDGYFKGNKSLGPEEQRVVAVPEVHTFYAVPGDVLMLACDGVYEPENMNWVFVSHFMLTLLYELKNDLTEAGVKLLEHAYQSYSGDNLSVLLTRFEKKATPGRKFRRFQVTQDGRIIPDGPSDGWLSDSEEDERLEAQKGFLKETTENPITI